jgi:hypothetical protein
MKLSGPLNQRTEALSTNANKKTSPTNRNELDGLKKFDRGVAHLADRIQSFAEEPMGVGRLVASTLRAAATGALVGSGMNRYYSDPSVLGILGTAANSAAIGGACGAGLGALARGKSIEYGAQAAFSGVTEGVANVALNRFLPWQPAVNGAIIGAGAALLVSTMQMYGQIRSNPTDH